MNNVIEQLMDRYDRGKMTRRELVLMLSTLVAARPEASSTGQANAAPIPVTTLNHVTLTVADTQRSVEFYQRVFGLPLVTTQGNETDWSADAVPVLGIGTGRQFVMFTQGANPSVNHYCFGMKDFDANQIVARLAEHNIDTRVRRRADSTPPAEELTFRDPDGIVVQIQDESYCGGSGVLGNLCNPDDRPR
ncbi:MAG: hypothetical protein CL484_15740 [Acidobacteria bacterium]|nr:hypothetical protein [Acidobacteriota bacterium]|tara:strand:- start:513 stop:1085 length:573 start_codon:yes stop_codon:yes gene_type:complete